MVWYVSMFAFSKHFRSSILRIIRQRWMKSNKMHVCTQLLSHVWLFVASWNATLTESSVHGIFQARILECVATSYLGDLPDPHLLHTLVQSLSCVWLFVTPWIARWASLSITNSWSLLHRVSDAIEPSHPLSSPSCTFNLAQHQGLFQWVSSLHWVAKVLEFQLQHQSFQWTLSTDLI